MSRFGVQVSTFAGSFAQPVSGPRPSFTLVGECAIFFRSTTGCRWSYGWGVLRLGILRLVLIPPNRTQDGLGGGLTATTWVHRRDRRCCHAVAQACSRGKTDSWNVRGGGHESGLRNLIFIDGTLLKATGMSGSPLRKASCGSRCRARRRIRGHVVQRRSSIGRVRGDG